jgi:large subunit ribosomal protein L6
MSRIANNPVTVPSSVEIAEDGQQLTVKGPKGTLEHRINDLVAVSREEGKLKFSARNSSKQAGALAGTTRSLVSNMVIGVSDGFERKLELVGVGYRAQAKGKVINLTLGFSHPIDYELPAGITVETPSPTEIVIKGNDKQRVGQVAAEIRDFRPPEPYKGKGVRYSDEVVVRKEAKKK